VVRIRGGRRARAVRSAAPGHPDPTKGDRVADEERISTSRRVAAPAHAIFELVSDPRGHVLIDGSGMLVAADGAVPVTRVGDAFEMDMDREPLGDVPLGRYRVRNAVTKFVADRQIEWLPAALGRDPAGHVYGYLLEPVGPAETEVTSYCDWSGVSAETKSRRVWPIVPAAALEKSLEKLERISTEQH
jgi:hypothetical protein